MTPDDRSGSGEPSALNEQLAISARRLDDVRAAIAWAFSPDGDEAVGVALTAACAPLWFGLSLMAEYQRLAQQALPSLHRLVPGNPAQEMKLCEALGNSLWHTRGSGPAMSAAFSRSLEIAEQVDDTEFQLRSIWGLWLISNSTGAYHDSVELALRFDQIASAKGPTTKFSSDRMMALSLHGHGQQGRAFEHAQRSLEHAITGKRRARHGDFQFVDPLVAALTVLARIQSVRGFADQSMGHAQRAVEEALTIGHALSLCASLAFGAVPVAIWAGDLQSAGRYTKLLLLRSTEHSLFYWQSFGECFRQVLDRRAGLPAPPSPIDAPFFSRDMKLSICTVDEGFADEEALRCAEEGTEGWCMPELLRIKGERVLATAREDAQDRAASLFLKAMAVAREQQALSWELRSAVSVAQLRRLQGRVGEAQALLEEVLGRFSEGFGTSDILGAENLLEGLRACGVNA